MRLYNVPQSSEFKFTYGCLSAISVGAYGDGLRQIIVPFNDQREHGSTDYKIGRSKSQRPKIILENGDVPSDGTILWATTFASDQSPSLPGEIFIEKESARNLMVIAWGIAGFRVETDWTVTYQEALLEVQGSATLFLKMTSPPNYLWRIFNGEVNISQHPQASPELSLFHKITDKENLVHWEIQDNGN